VFITLMALSWWYPLIDDDRNLFNELVLDITWVLSQTDTSPSTLVATGRRRGHTQPNAPATPAKSKEKGAKKAGPKAGNKRKPKADYTESDVDSSASNKRKRFL
jgi:hypothetical protein